MNASERFKNIMEFRPVDRMPVIEWATWWDKTVDRWKGEGLRIPPRPPLSEWQSLQVEMGLDLNLQEWISFTTPATPAPAYHGAPLVSSVEEYEAIRDTLYPELPFDPERLRMFAEYRAREEAIVWFTLTGPFWGPRTLMGIEPHLYAFYDQPELMHMINRDIAEYNMRVFELACRYVSPDFITFAEDMSYNNGPMISEALFDEFLLPYYERQVPAVKAAGAKVFVDSDGDISMALPWFARAGVEGILPLERQAGVDLLKLRESYPNFLFIGHFDKMVMHRGLGAVRTEFERLLPVMRQGGFIASVDHQTPPGVSLSEYIEYVALLKEYAQKLAEVDS